MRRLEKKGSMNQRIDVVLRKFRSRMSSYPPGMCPLSLSETGLLMDGGRYGTV